MALQKKVRLEQGDRFAFENIGDRLTGYYAGTDEIETDYGRSKRHALKTKKGLVTFFGNAQINQDLAEIPVGVYVEIELTGKKKVKRGTMKVFDFAYDLDDVDQSAPEAAAAASDASATEEDLADADQEHAGEPDAELEEAEATPPPPARQAKQPATVDKAKQDRARDLLSRSRR